VLPLTRLAPATRAQAGTVTALRMTTTPDLSAKVMARTPLPAFTAMTATSSDVVVNPAATHQPFMGVGAALTDSAAYVLTHYLDGAGRAALLSELYSPSQCNWQMLRVCMGSADFRAMAVGYTYDDMPAGQTDPSLAHFSTAPDQAYVLPVIQQVVAINPAVSILATPWTPPAWMLATGSFEANQGTFNTAFYAAYAQYFVKFLQAYEAAGVPVWAVTAANEPVAGTFMNLPQSQEESFIGSHLGPALAAAGFGSVKILALDDSWTKESYAAAVLGNSGAAAYTAGAAWHGYRGSPSAMSTLHGSHPSAQEHLTEFRSLTSQTLAYQMASVAGGYTAQGVANWARSVILWNLALDQNGEPNQAKPGRIPAVTVDNGTGALTRRTGYYALTHLSAFAQPGARRCTAKTFGQAYVAPNTLPNAVTTAALANPDGSAVLYAWNGHTGNTTFRIIDARTKRGTKVTMAAGELSTFVWPSGQ